MKKIIFQLLFSCLLINHVQSQLLVSGNVTDEKKLSIPYATIYAKNNADLRTITDINGYYEMRLFPGEYFLIFSAEGYEDRESYVMISEKPIQRNIQLFPQKINEIQEIKVTTKKSNPGRDILLKVIEKREKISPWSIPHKVDVYIKASEQVTYKDKNKEKSKDVSGIDDPFELEKKKLDSIDNRNFVEVQINRSFAPPNNVKEERTGYNKRGNDRNLYYLSTVKSNFNFFQNLIHLDDLHQTPITSPISVPGILSYRYRLEAKYEENGQTISRIKILPRNSSTSTLEGYIWVIDSLWMIQKIELSLNKGNLLVFDYFKIKQTYINQGDSLCVLSQQDLDYGVKFKDQSSKCYTKANFSSYQFNSSFTKKYFGNELAVTTQEAYEKDSSFWNASRKIEFTPEEKAFVLAKDSIRDAHNRTEYLDSVDRVFNKLTFWKVVWFGIDHRNRAKKTQWTISSLAGVSRPLYIAGPRIAPSFFYFKKWKDERALDSYTELSMGFLNADLKGKTWWRYRFDPFHFGTVNFSLENDFDVIRPYDAITQIYQRDNFIEKTALKVGGIYELFNGFYTELQTEFSNRRSINGYKFFTELDNTFPNKEPLVFNPYNAFLAELTLSYTPKQKYLREPYRKVLLGSKFPTFYAKYERGIPYFLGSVIDHEYARIGMIQTLKIGTLGTTSYHLTASKFLSSRNLQWADFKFQRRSDPIWFSNPLYSFQGLDTLLPSKDLFAEFHFIHHDNGALMNKIPFMKKTGISIAIGGGAMFVKEFQWQHYELFGGLERNFKFSKRRLRIGFYATIADGNKIDPSISYKFSFAILDDRDMKWNF